MIGTLNLKEKEVTVVGAGISGLLMAYVLDKHGFEVTLLDEASRAGGLIHTSKTEQGIAEAAAHSLLATDEVREICEDLGVTLAEVRPESRARYVYRAGRLRRFPLSVFETIRAFFRALLMLSAERSSRGAATLEAWALRHLGKAPLTYLISPFVTGIFATRPSELAVGAAFPSLEVGPGDSLISAQLRKWRLRRAARHAQQSSNQKFKKKMVAPLGGMEALTGALKERLEKRLGKRFQLGVSVKALPRSSNTVLCVPAHVASRLLQGEDNRLSDELSKVSYAPLVSVTIFLPRAVFKKAPSGVGVLIPEKEKREALGVLFNSSAFPDRVSDEHGLVSLTMMLGGTRAPERASQNENEIQSLVYAELQAIFRLSSKDVRQAKLLIHQWPKAIPIYNDHLLGTWKAAREGWCSAPGRMLFGNYTGEVSIRGMMQSVHALGKNLAAGLHP